MWWVPTASLLLQKEGGFNSVTYVRMLKRDCIQLHIYVPKYCHASHSIHQEQEKQHDSNVEQGRQRKGQNLNKLIDPLCTFD